MNRAVHKTQWRAHRARVALASAVMLGATAGFATVGIPVAGAEGCGGTRCGVHIVAKSGENIGGGSLYRCVTDGCSGSGSGFGGSSIDGGASGGINVHQGLVYLNGPLAFEASGVAHQCVSC